MKNIYNLELHETIRIKNNDIAIMRVAGGWIYEKKEGEHSLVVSSVFVPFNDEFQDNLTHKIYMLERKLEDIEMIKNNPKKAKTIVEKILEDTKKLKDEKDSK